MLIGFYCSATHILDCGAEHLCQPSLNADVFAAKGIHSFMRISSCSVCMSAAHAAKGMKKAYNM